MKTASENVNEKLRQLSRQETHDLSMIIKDRAKVLKCKVHEMKADCMADFEKKLAAEFSFDQDEVWETATREAAKVVTEAQDKIIARCKELGIPAAFAPGLELAWRTRGENLTSRRRNELRAVAESAIDAMARKAETKIEKQACDLRTQVVAMGLMSPDAKMFLESLAPIEETMRALEFKEVEILAVEDQKKRHRSGSAYDF